jgi:hypothetical protein
VIGSFHPTPSSIVPAIEPNATDTTETGRDWFLLEVGVLFASLVSGAALRYLLSTAIPFDASEFAALSDATTRDHSIRALFIMFNGMSLMALYLLVRRSAGVAAAFAALLLLQTSLGFQEWALRVRAEAIAIPIALGALTWWRHTRPPWRPPQAVARILLIVAVTLGVRGIVLGVSLPGRVTAIRSETAADSEALYRSLAACGGGVVTPLASLRTCSLDWPRQRSLAQQEALLVHAQQLPEAVLVRDDADPLPESGEARVAVFDRDGAGVFLVAEGAAADVALRVIGAGPARGPRGDPGK